MRIQTKLWVYIIKTGRRAPGAMSLLMGFVYTDEKRSSELLLKLIF